MNRLPLRHPPLILPLCVRPQSTRTLTRLGEQVPNALPFEKIPLVKGYPLIGSLIDFVQNLDRLHKLFESRVKQYGPIYREQHGFGKKATHVFTANIDDWKNILRGEMRGKPAGRRSLWSLDAYTNKRGKPQEMVNIRDKNYERIKAGMKPLLMPKTVEKLVAPLSEITDDLLNCLIRRANDNGVIDDIRDIIHKWSFECGGFIAFHKRFDLLTDDYSLHRESMLEFYRNARRFFHLLYVLECGSPHHRTLMTKTWKEYEQVMDTIFSTFAELIAKYGEYVIDKRFDFTDEEKISHIKNIVIASADTTAHTAIWTLIELSKNPELQENLFEELTAANVPSRGPLRNSHLQLPYLRGTMKEMYRMRPLLPMMNKVLAEDLILSGYEVPSGTEVYCLTDAYDKEKEFIDADIIKPERWARAGREQGKCPNSGQGPTHRHDPNPFAVLPFGHGMRSCLGRRIAENELLIFVAKIVKRFKLTAINKDFDTKFCLFVTPKGEVCLKVEER